MSENKRVIKLKLLTQTALHVVETSARTLGEFKTEISDLDIDWSSTKLIDRETKASFEVDEAVLPAINAIMFVMPTKSKAGADLSYKEVKAKIKAYKAGGGNVPFNYTRATTSELNKFWSSVETINEVTESVEEDTNEVITLSPGTYTVVVEGDVVELVEEVTVVDCTTEEDLDAEAKELRKSF